MQRPNGGIKKENVSVKLRNATQQFSQSHDFLAAPAFFPLGLPFFPPVGFALLGRGSSGTESSSVTLVAESGGDAVSDSFGTQPWVKKSRASVS